MKNSNKTIATVSYTEKQLNNKTYAQLEKIAGKLGIAELADENATKDNIIPLIMDAQEGVIDVTPTKSEIKAANLSLSNVLITDEHDDDDIKVPAAPRRLRAILKEEKAKLVAEGANNKTVVVRTVAPVAKITQDAAKKRSTSQRIGAALPAAPAMSLNDVLAKVQEAITNGKTVAIKLRSGEVKAVGAEIKTFGEDKKEYIALKDEAGKEHGYYANAVNRYVKIDA